MRFNPGDGPAAARWVVDRRRTAPMVRRWCMSTRGNEIGAMLLGSAPGGTARYWPSGAVGRTVGKTFPWGTMAVNITSALAIGILAALAAGGGWAAGSSRSSSCGWCSTVRTEPAGARRPGARARPADLQARAAATSPTSGQPCGIRRVCQAWGLPRAGFYAARTAPGPPGN